MIKVYYMHVRKYHKETHHAQIIYANKKKGKNDKTISHMSEITMQIN